MLDFQLYARHMGSIDEAAETLRGIWTQSAEDGSDYSALDLTDDRTVDQIAIDYFNKTGYDICSCYPALRA